jgi:4-amino-4-deoxy-L-arabinose transferase-like glycosyltransferase
MYLNNYQHQSNKETLTLVFLLIFSIIIRVPIILMFGDVGLENEWKILVENMTTHGKFSIINFNGYFLPNLYMPPLYPFYLYFFTIFNLENQNYVQLVLWSQVFLSSISVIIFYKINKLFFSYKLSFFSSLLFTLFPLHLYACSQISSISLQSFFTLIFIYFFFKITKNKDILSIIIFSFISGLLILLRGEYVAIIIFSLLYLFTFFSTSLKKILLIILIVFITISPYLIRNVIIFESATITKSVGYNLWKGNNSNSTVQGSELIDKDLQNQIEKISKDKFYRIKFDNIFFNKAIENIMGEPTKYLILFLKKFASFLFIDIASSNPIYYNPFHYLPVLLLGVTSLGGITLSNKKSHKLNYLIFIFFINAIIFSSFFILPRYKLVILPFQIIFTNILIDYISKKFFSSSVLKN